MEQANLRGQFAMPSRQLPPLVNQVPPLVMSSSNVSTATLDSELVSPDPSQEAQFVARPLHVSKPVLRESRSPSAAAASDDSAASYNGKAPVLNVGSKRTASGQAKQSSPTRGYSRDSTKSHSAIELSADLRTRLKYAMLKVQNGWESQNIQQLEELQVASPKTVMTDSPSRWSRRDSSSSISDAAYYASPFSTTSITTTARASDMGHRPHDTSRILQRQLQFSPQPPPTHSQYTLPPIRAAAAPSHRQSSTHLAPPAQITASSSSSSSHRRSKSGSYSSRFGPQLSRHSNSSRPRSGSIATTSPSVTSTTPRGIHTKAEKDAVDSLLFMSSPVHAATGRTLGRKRSSTFTSGSAVHGASPLRHKRVDFVTN